MRTRARIATAGAVIAIVVLIALLFVLLFRDDRSTKDEGAGIAASSADADPGPPRAASARGEPGGEAPDPSTALESEPAAEPTADDVLVYGLVVDDAGSAIPGAAVEITSPDEAAHPRPWVSPRDTADGSFACAGLAPGTWRVTARAPGHHDLDGLLDIGPEPYRRLDLRLDPNVLLPVRLDFRGGGLDPTRSRNIAVIATREAPTEPLPMRSSASHAGYGVGRWHSNAYGASSARIDVPAGFDGLLELVREGESEGELPVFVSATYKSVPLDTVLVAEPGEVTLTVPEGAIEESLGSVTVRFLESGVPREGVSVSIGNTQGGGGASAETGDDGVARLERVEPGLLIMRCRDYDPATRRGFSHVEFVHLEPGGELDLGTIAYELGATIPIALVDPDGSPVAGSVWYRFLDRLRPYEPLRPNSTHTVPDDGVAELPAGQRGRYLILGRADSRGFGSASGYRSYDRISEAVVVDTTNRPTEPVPVVVREPTSVLVYYAGLPSDASCGFRVVDERGIPVHSGPPYSSPLDFWLLPGSYALELVRDAAIVRSMPFEVGSRPRRLFVDLASEGGLEGEATAFEKTLGPLPASAIVRNEGSHEPPSPLEVPTGTMLTGRIVDAAGDPVEHATVVATNGSGARRPATVQASNYAVQGLSEGAWTVSLSAPGFAYEKIELEIEPDRAWVERELVLSQRTVVVRVSVVTPEGELLGRALHARADEFGAGFYRTIREASVIATLEPPAEELGETSARRASTAGIFRDDRSGSGTLTITEDLPVFVSYVLDGRVFASTELTEPTDRVELVVSADAVLERLRARKIEVTLRVEDATTGATLEPDNVSLLPRSTFGTTKMPPRYDASGRLLLEAMEAGPSKLAVDVPGYEPYRALVDIAQEPNVDLGVIALSRASTLRGEVVDEDGRPVSCRFQVGRPGEKISPLGGLGGQTGQDGTFEIELGPSTYTLRFWAGPAFASRTFVVDGAAAPPADEPVRYVLRRGTEVRMTSTGPTRHAVIRDERGNVVTETAVTKQNRSPLRLAPGDYTVEILVRDEVVRTLPLAVAGEPVEFEIGD